MEALMIVVISGLFGLFIYDKYIQREHQLLINYPVIGRMRYFFEAIREPFRQYFGDESFYESKDKIDWVYNAAHNKAGYISFSPSKPQPNPKFMIKHSNIVLNDDEVNEDFSVIFGANKEKPFRAKTHFGRSAMSDGAISPEGTRAFVKGAYDGKFPINTGEGGLTTNFFFTHRDNNEPYMERIAIEGFDRLLYKFLSFTFDTYKAVQFFRNKLLDKKEVDTFIFDFKTLVFFRPNWNGKLETFPKEVPDDMPDIIFQIGSGLYGVRDKQGNFDEDRYLKTISFCRMTEIKIAQGAKQTGGKLAKEKVTDSIAYFRGVEPYQNLISPNRFPYANSTSELFDFIGKLQNLSKKPVGLKIVISGRENIEEIAQEIVKRKTNNISGIPDFITLDGGDGGSATAPLYLMDRIGFHVKDGIHLVDKVLKQYNVRDEVKIIASGKVLTPDDIVVTLGLGADYVNIGRGFMMSGGCIRARMCSGYGSHKCPVGLATSDKRLRKAYLVIKNASHITNYHHHLTSGIKTILAVMGLKNIKDINQSHLTFVDTSGFIHTDVERYMDNKLDIN